MKRHVYDILIDFVQTVRAEFSHPYVYEICYDLMKIAKSLARLNEVRCNQELSGRQETRYRNLVNHATAKAEFMGMKLITNQDPRGPSLLLKLPSGRTNDWGRIGYIVPEVL